MLWGDERLHTIGKLGLQHVHSMCYMQVELAVGNKVNHEYRVREPGSARQLHFGFVDIQWRWKLLDTIYVHISIQMVTTMALDIH